MIGGCRGSWTFWRGCVATAFGSGYSPFAPGTAGSAVGLLLFWPMAGWGWPWQVGACLALLLVGALAATRVAERVGSKDPGIVVVDEVLGQWVTLLALPFTPATAASASCCSGRWTS